MAASSSDRSRCMAGKCVRPDFSISPISVCTLLISIVETYTKLPRGPFQEREPRKMTRAAGGVDGHTKVLADSPLQGDGFEPSVPYKKQPFLAAPVRFRNSPSATKTDPFVPGTDSSNPSPSREESANHRFLSPHACDRRIKIPGVGVVEQIGAEIYVSERAI